MTPTEIGFALGWLLIVIAAIWICVKVGRQDAPEAIRYCRELLPPLTPAERLDARLGELSQQPIIPIMWVDPPRRLTAKVERERVGRGRLNLFGCSIAGDSIGNNVLKFEPVWRSRS